MLSNPSKTKAFLEDPLRTGAVSNASGAPEADRHLAPLDDDRHRAATLAELEHPRELGRVLLDVDVGELEMPPCIVVTGGLRVGSGVFAEDVDHDAIVQTQNSKVKTQNPQDVFSFMSSVRAASGIGIAFAD